MNANFPRWPYPFGLFLLIILGFMPSLPAAVITNPIAETIQNDGLQIQFTTMTAALVSPLGVVAPNDSSNRIFIYDQVGKIHTMSRNGGSVATLLDISSRLVTLNSGYDERGLLGVALHPSFATNRKFYTYSSEPASGTADFTTNPASSANHQSVIAEWQVQAGNPNAADLASRREIMRIDQPQSNHNGGYMAFGPDGKLYIGLGDGGGAHDVGSGHDPVIGNGQNINVVYGKILRIDVDTANSSNGKYGIPADNPFVGKDGLDEIYAFGLRNPYSFSFDRSGGQLYAGDVGQANVEEVDIITAGGNYGWRYKEGSFYFDWNNGTVVTEPLVPVPAGMIDPIAEYDHDEGTAIIGGFVYRGSVSLLQGRYIFGDYAANTSGRLFYLNAQGKIKEFAYASGLPLRYFVKGFGEDQLGEVYVCLSRNAGPSGTSGTVVRISGVTPRRAAQAVTWVMY